MVEFKKVEMHDLKIIQKIAFETWPNTFGQVMSTEQINYMLELMYNENSLKQQIVEKHHIFLLAENDNQPVGFTSYETNYNLQPQLMIHKLYLLPSTQGMGIGTKLINLLSTIAVQNDNKRLRLKVYFKNIKAITFYEKCGFKKTGSETTDLGNNYIAFDSVMIKDLSNSTSTRNSF